MRKGFSPARPQWLRAGAALALCGVALLEAQSAGAADDPAPEPPAPPSAEPGTPLPQPSPASAPPTPAAAEHAPAASGELSAEEAAALAGIASGSSSTGSSELGLDEPTFNLYGFADFTYSTQVGEKAAFNQQQSSFAVGKFNVYFSTEFEKHWRSLAEVRFMYLPNGSWPGDSAFANTSGVQRTNTSVLDGSDLNHPVRWGGIAIQRIWLEYEFDKYLTLRAGQWLTPYGIWNVDHGSPTIINVYRPYIIDQELFPERQTGLEAYGGFFVRDTKIGYHLTLSNGRGPIDAYRDLDNNKAIGGRLYLQNDALLGTFTLGTSVYRGTYTDRTGSGVAVENNRLISNDPPTLKYDELALAFDVKWEFEGLHVQSEVIMNEIAYRDGVRPVVDSQPPPPRPSLAADNRSYGFYALVGYRTPWWNIMPFALYQYTHIFSPSKEMAFGINVRPSPRVALKAEYKYIFIDPPPDGVEIGDLDFLGLQVAWSF